MSLTSFFHTGFVTVCLSVLTLVIALPSQALSISFAIESGSTVSISGGTPDLAFEGMNPSINFTVTLSNESDVPVSVDFGTLGGSASGGFDYTEQFGTLTFEPGVTEQTITVQVLYDDIIEDIETFSVELIYAEAATDPPIMLDITKSTGVGLIADMPRLLTTSWDKRFPYNADPYDGDMDGQNEIYTFGCTAVALGQLINYYFQEPEGYNRDGWLEVMLEYVTVWPRFCPPTTTKRGKLSLGGWFCKKGDKNKDGIYVQGFQTETSYVDAISISEKDSPEADALRNFLWNVALGLDSMFYEDDNDTPDDESTTSGGALYWSDAFSGALSEVFFNKKQDDQIINLLRDRFLFKDTITRMPTEDAFFRLDEREQDIKDSIDARQPILMSLTLKVGKKNPGHTVLIDGYRETPEGDFEVRINWGWGNKSKENDKFYSTDGPFEVIYTYLDGTQKVLTVYDFVLYLNVIPLNY